MRHELIGLLGRRVQGERVIDILLDGERHMRVGAINGTRGRVHEVLDAVVATSFDNVQKAGHVAVDVYVRVFDRIAHSSLRGQMNHPVELLGGEQSLDAASIG
jgi:aspartate 1-decarboxylase